MTRARRLTLAVVSAGTAMLLLDVTVLASGVNNTFRQLGIAGGIAGLGAIFTHHEADVVGGLNAVFLTVAAVAVLGALAAWPLRGELRSDPAETRPVMPSSVPARPL